MCKRILTIAAIVLAISVLALANTATIDQSGGTANTAYTEQDGAGNTIYIKQAVAHGTGTNTAGTSSTDKIYQKGNNNIANLDQTAASIAASPDTQSNLAKINQVGNKHKLVGATAAGLLDVDSSKAVQKSDYRGNTLNINQIGGNGNKIGLYQSAKFENNMGTTSAEIAQNGYENELVAYQTTSAGATYVFTATKQIGNHNIARFVQTAGGGHQKATVIQDGSYNLLVGASADGSIDSSGAAMQTTGSAWGGNSNELIVTQSGSFNEVGLHQSTSPYKVDGLSNYASISQIAGNNKLGAYQDTTSGSNWLSVTQNGNDTATVVQTGSGNNTATVNQL
jgi:hypothetical protein